MISVKIYAENQGVHTVVCSLEEDPDKTGVVHLCLANEIVEVNILELKQAVDFMFEVV